MLKPVVNVENTSFQASKGKMFIGTTDTLKFGPDTSAWARLYNPIDSTVNLFINTYFISNLSEVTIFKETYLNALPPGERIVSNSISNTNLGSRRTPQGIIEFNPSVIGEPSGGVKVTTSPVTSLGRLAVGELMGQLIIVPGTSFLVFFKSESMAEATFDIIWFESKEIIC
ncbi:DUF6143 family protein [Bacillus carboniphilus]|uniref:DUF6143 family protein n=1 Tax=Bacillus carboniphilus TaxID=86663 RepID=A0ABY9JVI2_9BACI|nr:DUF6143 family protein [Bacillus carboniphilus]WLR43390.1 DUF6143 family protein [Bacillus carboniphilus]